MTREANEVPSASAAASAAGPIAGHRPPPLRADAPARPADAVTSWLDMLDALLRVPARDRAEIRAELESHLRDRTHDLMFSGLDADQAARRATTELGEAAELAGRFHETRTQGKRRRTMNILGIGMAAAAVVVSVSALVANSGSPRLRVVMPDPPVAAEGQPAGTGRYELRLDPRMVEGELELQVVPILGRLPIVSYFFKQPQAGTEAASPSAPAAAPPAEFSADEDHPSVANRFSVSFNDTRLRDALEFAAKAINRTLLLDQPALDDISLDKGTLFTVSSAEVDLPEFFGLLRSLHHEAGKIEYRVTETTLQVSTQDGFDRRESVLSAYDIDDLLEIPGVDADRLRETLKELVFPEGWNDNGGDKARAHVVGRTLFVEAPRRFHQKIQWIFGEIRKSGAAWMRGKEGRDSKAGSDATEVKPAIERYPIQHLAAAEALESIKKLNSIRRVDFTRFSADQSTNSIIGLVPPEDHELVKGAIQDIDKPGADEPGGGRR